MVLAEIFLGHGFCFAEHAPVKLVSLWVSQGRQISLMFKKLGRLDRFSGPAKREVPKSFFGPTGRILVTRISSLILVIKVPPCYRISDPLILAQARFFRIRVIL